MIRLKIIEFFFDATGFVVTHLELYQNFIKVGYTIIIFTIKVEAIINTLVSRIFE